MVSDKLAHNSMDTDVDKQFARDLLIEIKTQVKFILDELKNLKSDTATIQADHESRIRKLESNMTTIQTTINDAGKQALQRMQVWGTAIAILTVLINIVLKFIVK